MAGLFQLHSLVVFNVWNGTAKNDEHQYHASICRSYFVGSHDETVTFF